MVLLIGRLTLPLLPEHPHGSAADHGQASISQASVQHLSSICPASVQHHWSQTEHWIASTAFRIVSWIKIDEKALVTLLLHRSYQPCTMRSMEGPLKVWTARVSQEFRVQPD